MNPENPNSQNEQARLESLKQMFPFATEDTLATITPDDIESYTDALRERENIAEKIKGMGITDINKQSEMLKKMLDEKYAAEDKSTETQIRNAMANPKNLGFSKPADLDIESRVSAELKGAGTKRERINELFRFAEGSN